MSDQALLDFGPPGDRWRFLEFHETNPHVYDGLRRLALRAVARGHRRWSINGLFEVLRWEVVIETDDADGWRLNNTYRAWYARLLMAREPALAGFFETRTAKADGEAVA